MRGGEGGRDSQFLDDQREEDEEKENEDREDVSPQDTVASVEDGDGVPGVVADPVVVDMRQMLRVEVRQVRDLICDIITTVVE
jgi:hypothetical protein